MIQLLLQAPISNSVSLNTVVAGLVVIAALFLVSLPKPTQTWYSLGSFMAAFWLELWRSFTRQLRGIKRKIRTLAKTVVFTSGREWLDETEQQITE